MIELKDIKLDEKDAPKEAFSMKFDKGLNRIKFEDKYLYKLLKFKSDLSDGTILVDDKQIFPYVNDESSFFYLSINSQVFCLDVCLIKGENFKETQKNLLDKLNALKDMPLTNDEEKKAKIDSIVNIIKEFNPSFVLFDRNNSINNENEDLINKSLEVVQNDLCLISYQRDLNKETFQTICLDEKPSRFKENKKEVLRFLKVNYIQYLFLTLESLILVFLGFLVPYFFCDSEQLTVAIISLVCAIFILGFLTYFNYSIYKFNKKNKAEIQLGNINLFNNLFSMAFSFIGIIIAFVLFFVLLNFNVLVNKEKFVLLTIISPVALSVVSLVIPFLSKYIDKLVEKIKSKN